LRTPGGDGLKMFTIAQADWRSGRMISKDQSVSDPKPHTNVFPSSHVESLGK